MQAGNLGVSLLLPGGSGLTSAFKSVQPNLRLSQRLQLSRINEASLEMRQSRRCDGMCRLEPPHWRESAPTAHPGDASCRRAGPAGDQGCRRIRAAGRHQVTSVINNIAPPPPLPPATHWSIARGAASARGPGFRLYSLPDCRSRARQRPACICDGMSVRDGEAPTRRACSASTGSPRFCTVSE